MICWLYWNLDFIKRDFGNIIVHLETIFLKKFSKQRAGEENWWEKLMLSVSFFGLCNFSGNDTTIEDFSSLLSARQVKNIFSICRVIFDSEASIKLWAVWNLFWGIFAKLIFFIFMVMSNFFEIFIFFDFSIFLYMSSLIIKNNYRYYDSRDRPNLLQL